MSAAGGSEPISRARLDEVCELLTAAGDQWRTVAAELPEVGEVVEGDELLRDRCRLTGEVFYQDLPSTWSGPSTLYRNEHTGKWWATGWSDASKQQVNRPSVATFDPDAGVYVVHDDADLYDGGAL